MSLFFRGAPQQRDSTVAQMLADRTSGRSGTAQISTDQAMRHSVVWAATRLRADVVSMMPIDTYKRLSDGTLVEVPTAPVLISPDNFADDQPTPISDWIYAGQWALDSWGNSIGIIRTINATTKIPTQIELVPADMIRLTIKGTRITQYKIAGERVDARHIWHERQFLVPGLPFGLSPITYAVMSLAGAINAQTFIQDFFAHGGVPAAHLKNIEKELDPVKSARVKQRFKAAVGAGDVFVSGRDWTYEPISVKAAESGFLQQIDATSRDICRFLGAPADLIDVQSGGSSITYANITQRNLQFLTLNMGASIKRREDALGRLTPKPHFVKLNRSAVLAMDDKTRADIFKLKIDSRTLTPDQARAIEDNEPLTEADYAQFDRLFGSKNPAPAPRGTQPA